MKYLFQQLLAFAIIIVTILVIVGVSVVQFSRNTIIRNTYQQLFSYAKTVKENASNTEEGMTADSLMNAMETSRNVLGHEDVQFYYVDSHRNVTYPKTGELNKEYVSEKDWQHVRNGETVQKIGQMGQNHTLVMIIEPLFEWSSGPQTENKLAGAILVTQSINNVEGSLKTVTANLLKGFFLSSFVALIVSYVLAKFQVNRINRMRSATKQIAHGNFDIHLEEKNNDELDDLAKDFNQMAEALKTSNEEINRQEELRKQFMADAAHEMRTPLTTINGLLEGFAYDAIPEDQKQKCVELMQNETKRLIRLVNENLDYEKIRTNQISIMIQKFSATQVLKTVVEQLRAKAEASHDELRLVTTEEIDIYADYDRFVQIMVNIIQNAIQFTENGQITVNIEKGQNETTVHIKDTGIGMTEEEVKNIWDRYYKADPSRKSTKYGESGLGLAIVHQLMKLHRGSINVVSQKDVGSTFSLTFPDSEPEE